MGKLDHDGWNRSWWIKKVMAEKIGHDGWMKYVMVDEIGHGGWNRLRWIKLTVHGGESVSL